MPPSVHGETVSCRLGPRPRMLRFTGPGWPGRERLACRAHRRSGQSGDPPPRKSPCRRHRPETFPPRATSRPAAGCLLRLVQPPIPHLLAGADLILTSSRRGPTGRAREFPGMMPETNAGRQFNTAPRSHRHAAPDAAFSPRADLAAPCVASGALRISPVKRKQQIKAKEMLSVALRQRGRRALKFGAPLAISVTASPSIGRSGRDLPIWR
jgi:hypothetical protein